MRKLPPLNAVRAFEAAARHGSFSRAAQELHVTPSAISHQIRILEEYLGVSVFLRLTRKVRLTPHGEALLPPVGSALTQIETATRQLAALDKAQTTLTLSVSPSFAAEWLIPRLTAFQDLNRRFDVRLLTDHRLPDFATGDVDVAIVAGHGDWPGLQSHKLSDEDMVPVCRPALLLGKGALRQPADLRHATLIHVSTQPDRWPDWLQAAGVAHPEPRQGPQLPTTALALEAAQSGLGVALANRLFATPHLGSGELAVAFDIDLMTGRGYYLVYPPMHAERAPVAAICRWLTTTATTSP